MQIERRTWEPSRGWSEALPHVVDPRPVLILSFGPVDVPPSDWFEAVSAAWPNAQHLYCSGGGQIVDGVVDDHTTSVSVIAFDSATVHPVVRHDAQLPNSALLGASMGAELSSIPGLRHVLIFAEGLSLNGAAFVAAMTDALPSEVRLSGGLASNGTALTRTVVGLNAPPTSGTIVAIGLVGDALDIGTGSVGGWDYFGPERVATRSDGTVLFELDGERALDVYKRYLGEFARELPGTALMFPLAVWQSASGPLTVRTILAIDEETGALRFAGDIPQGSTVRLMRTTTDKLIEGAAQAATMAAGGRGNGSDDGAPTLAPWAIALCVSCIGRRAVMRSRVDEELDEVVLAARGAPVVGFYGNGEIAPPSDGRTFDQAVLHNQTMTVTMLGERT